jgi:gamma-glutamyltranspeptidase/glutathione hydrolase/leukotriene-C4 hydrolase
MTIRVPTSTDGRSSEVWTVDFRETAPSLANRTMFNKDPSKATIGGLAVGVPGEVRGLEEAHKRWGSLPWERLVRPSVELAAGWKVGKELAKRIDVRLSLCFAARFDKPFLIESTGQSLHGT